MTLAQLMSPDKLSLRDKLAQLLFVRIGSNLPPVRTVEDDAERIERLLSEYPLGGLLLFNGQRDQTAKTLERLQAAARYPLLVGADIERGIGQQIRGYTLFPHAMAFDALGDEAEQQVYEFARLTGIAARANGIHITFAPVADVNSDPRNPIIATRAFGADPSRVSQLVRAYVAGAKAGGILATAKHFPGHGNTHEDSHYAVPTVEGTRQQLESCELFPFRTAIAAGVPLLMTAHVRFPALDDSGNPATISPTILLDLLRVEMGFEGAVVSDSLLMGGVKSQFADEGDMVLHAILAGVDLPLDVHEPGRVIDSLENAVSDGRLPHERVDEAFSRLIKLRDLAFASPPVQDDLAEVIERSDQLARKVARQSIRVIESRRKLIPLQANRPLMVLMLRPHQSHLDPPEQPLGMFLREHFSDIQYRELKPDSDSSDYEDAIGQARAAEQLVIAMIVKPAAWHRFGLLPAQEKLVEELISHRECVVCCLGTPVALEKYAAATERICTYSDVFASQEALAQFLAGYRSA